MNRLLGNEQKDSHHAKAGIQPVDIRTRQEGTLVVGTLGEDTLEEDTLEAGTHLEQTGSHVEAGTPRAEVGIHLGTRTGTPYHYAYPFHLPFFLPSSVKLLQREKLKQFRWSIFATIPGEKRLNCKLS